MGRDRATFIIRDCVRDEIRVVRETLRNTSPDLVGDPS
jgi:hypothetical protein